MEDHEVIEMLSNNLSSERGYRILISKYKELLYWHIRRIVKNHEDADDILQNTFIKVFRNIDNFKQESSLKTWLYRIATNESITFLNNPKNRSFASLDNIQIDRPADEIADYDNLNQKLVQAIDTLPTKQKVVFNMRYYDEMSYQEIAAITDTSVGALKTSFHLAVKKIESLLKD
jgi:RNA polymerase sigma factor (sigma-70 family)